MELTYPTPRGKELDSNSKAKLGHSRGERDLSYCLMHRQERRKSWATGTLDAVLRCRCGHAAGLPPAPPIPSGPRIPGPAHAGLLFEPFDLRFCCRNILKLSKTPRW